MPTSFKREGTIYLSLNRIGVEQAETSILPSRRPAKVIGLRVIFGLEILKLEGESL